MCSMTIREMFLEENSSEQTASSFSLQPHYDSWEPEDTVKHEEMVLDTEEKNLCLHHNSSRENKFVYTFTFPPHIICLWNTSYYGFMKQSFIIVLDFQR